MSESYALSMLGIAIVFIIVLCVKFKIHAFIALISASLLLAISTGMPLSGIVSAMESGIGGMLAFLAPILALGAIVGKMMEVSGGAERLARTLINIMGKSRAHWAMLFVGYLCGIPVFFQVGIVLLIALMFSICRDAKLPVMQVALPMIIGLLTVHCIVPPHPAAMAITLQLKADVGKVIFYGLLVGFPAAVVAGPIFGKFIAKKYDIPISGAYADAKPREESELPPFSTAIFVTLLPLMLMISKTVIEMFAGKDASYMPLVNFIGSPMIALFISVLVSYVLFGTCRGFTLGQIGKFSEACLAPMASILLVIGAAGAFNKVILSSGVGEVLKHYLTTMSISPIIMAWIVAIIMRVTVGGATIAMVTAAGFMIPVLEAYPGLDPALIVIAIGAGSIGASHVTDPGFWFVKESMNISVGTMFATYTVATCIAAVLGLFGTLILAAFL